MTESRSVARRGMNSKNRRAAILPQLNLGEDHHISTKFSRSSLVRVFHVVGARPNFMKVAPVLEALRHAIMSFKL
jgi:hypothetical protein